MKKHVCLSTLALALAAAPALADLQAEQLLQERPQAVTRTEGRVVDAGALQGSLVLPAGAAQGGLVGLLLDEEGRPAWKLNARAERRAPQGNESDRFEYGTLVGEITAIDEGASLRRALVRGTWTRFGVASAAGELTALLIEPGSARVLGTLRARVGLVDEPLVLAAQAEGFVPVRVRRERARRPEPALASLAGRLGPCLHSPLTVQHVGAHDAASAQPLAPIVDPIRGARGAARRGLREVGDGQPVPTSAHGSFRGRWTLLAQP